MTATQGKEMPFVLLDEDGQLRVEYYGGTTIDLMDIPPLGPPLVAADHHMILLLQNIAKGLDVLLRTLARFEPMLKRYEQVTSWKRSRKGVTL